MKLHIVTPEGCVFSDDVRSVIVRTTEGDVGILKNHTNYVAVIAYGMLKITDTEGHARIAACMNGFVSAEAEQVRVIVTTFEFADEIDINRANLAKEKAEESLKSAKEERDIAIAKAKLLRAIARIDVASENI